jgi:alpha-tubulin suppressor-like RCC1 family protein
MLLQNWRVVTQPLLYLGPNVSAVAKGAYSTCVLFTNSSVKCWGSNPAQLGYGSWYTDGTGTVPSNVLFPGGLAAAIACGHHHTCIILISGALRCWGENGDGQLGYGDYYRRYTPAQDVAIAGPAATMSLGCKGTCVVLTNGDLYCWGFNGFGMCFHLLFR